MFDKLEGVVRRYEELTEKLADPTLYDRQAEFKKVSSERANLEEIVKCFNEYKRVRDEIQDAKDILKNSDLHKQGISENELLVLNPWKGIFKKVLSAFKESRNLVRQWRWCWVS